MRHHLVSRVAVVLAAVLLAAAAVFVRIVTPIRQDAQEPGVEVSGRTLFDTHCASCHAAEDLRPGLETLSVAAWLELEEFLDGHGDATREEDRLILEHLSADYSPPRD